MNLDLHHLIADKARIETILDFLPYPFLISQFRDGTYHNLYLNKRFKEELGWSLVEIPTIDDWFRVAYPDETYRQEVIKGWSEKSKQALENGEESPLMKVIVRTRDQGYQWFEVKSTVTGQFQLVAFVNIGEAIIREKAFERLLENKNQTLSILAHDLRAPVASMQSLAALLLNKTISEDEFLLQLQQLHHRSTQLLDFIDTTLLWTKANFDQIQVKSRSIELQETIKVILEIYEHTCQAKELNVLVALEKSTLESDPDILTILLRNIITNAIKFTPDRGTIRIDGANQNGNYCISVRDTGVGMTKETLSNVLRMDSYSSQAGTRQEKGLGLGLKLCQYLVQRINASLDIDSEPGKGTVVKVRFK